MMTENNQGDIIVPGEKVYLGQIRKDLAPVYRRWLNDLQVSMTLGVISYQGLPLTDEDEDDWYDAARKDKDETVFGIYERETGNPIGNCGLSGVRTPNRSAEFGIAIGERSAHGKGYGTEATKLILDYGFNILGLHHIWLKCVAFNHAGLRVYEKAGFRHAGRLREGWHFSGKQHDVILMDVLAREFESPVLAEMLHINELGSDGNEQ
jgi:RimJ/RimL family protein N-acetyltransferase